MVSMTAAFFSLLRSFVMPNKTSKADIDRFLMSVGSSVGLDLEDESAVLAFECI